MLSALSIVAVLTGVKLLGGLGVITGILILLSLACATGGDPTRVGPIDASLVLNSGTLTKTATFQGTVLDLGAGYAPGEGGIAYQASVPITAADFTSGDETYKWRLEESSDNATFTAASADYSTVAGDVGNGTLISGIVTKRYVRYVCTIAGTTPSITYNAFYLVPRR